MKNRLFILTMASFIICSASVGKTDLGAPCGDIKIIAVDQSMELIAANTVVINASLISNDVAAATLVEPVKTAYVDIDELSVIGEPPDFVLTQSVALKRPYTGNSRRSRDAITQRV